MEPLKLLLLDNDPVTLDFLQDQFRRNNDEIHVCEQPSGLVQFFGKDLPDVVILAREWSENSLETLDLLKREWEELPVIFVSRNGSVPDVVQVMKKGARDYFLKPLAETGIEKSILQAAKDSKLLRKVNQLQEVHERRGQFDGLIGVSYTMQRIYRMIESVARGDATVMITGESGVGKELVAQAVHRRSLRRKNPFVAVNCANIPASLLESELFGHEKGAFTGAVSRRAGMFERANHGTIFLDEVGETSPNMQVRLLRVLESGEMIRVGGVETLRVDVRVVAATNRNLVEAVRAGSFRQDLYYRLKGVSLYLPPLRERKDDIPLLVKAFIRRYCLEMNKELLKIAPSALKLLMDYDWPGNVRELENVIERALVIGRSKEIVTDDLPFSRKDLGAAEMPKSLKLMEKMHIKRILEETHWNISKTARLLEVDRQTLYNKIAKYTIEKES